MTAATTDPGKSLPIETSWLDLVSVIVIGRNEGARLERCLKSLSFVPRSNLVYVDSASTDGSVAFASSLNVHVVKLDTSQPFTAARARNAGVAFLSKRGELRRFIQFLDGDCELADGWIGAAATVLNENDHVAVVCGRRREKYPDRSIYNRLADFEWDTPVGEAAACGGDSLMRSSAFEELGGFQSMLMAGEELEFCARLSKRGWKILRVDQEMSRHDANMLSLKQWWFRGVRAGYVLIPLATLRSNPIRTKFAWELFRSVFWAFLVPLAIVTLAIFVSLAALFGLLLYFIQIFRIHRKSRFRGPLSWLYSSCILFDNFPRFQGILRFLAQMAIGRARSSVEYK